MINPVEVYHIGLDTFVFNRKISKKTRLFLNGFLLQHGLDYRIDKRNVKFTDQLKKGDVLEIESLEK